MKSYYICLRDENSTGKPNRTRVVADSEYFSDTGKSNKEECFKVLFMKLKHNAMRYSTPSDLLKAQDILTPDTNDKFWTTVLQENIKDIQTEPSEQLILLIIDEARSLKGGDDSSKQDFYVPFRRALLADGSRGIFCIMIDTNATVANFAPKKLDDPSTRVVQGTKLFHPWIVIPTMDIHLKLPRNCPLSRCFETIKCEEQKEFRYNRFDSVLHSRPLFMDGLLLESKKYSDPGRLWDWLVSFSRTKLFGSNCPAMDATVAVLAGRYSLIPVDISTQESLVANRMATLRRCSKSRDRILVSYVAEPVLGEGLAHHMNESFEGTIQALSELMNSGKLSLAGNKGDYGELVAAISLSRAFDFLRTTQHFGRPVMVKSILALFDIKKCNIIQRNQARASSRKSSLSSKYENTFPVVLGSLVGFLQFIRLSKNLSKEMLGKGFQKRVAFFTCTNTPACDLVVPIFLLRRAAGTLHSSILAND